MKTCMEHATTLLFLFYFANCRGKVLFILHRLFKKSYICMSYFRNKKDPNSSMGLKTLNFSLNFSLQKIRTTLRSIVGPQFGTWRKRIISREPGKSARRKTTSIRNGSQRDGGSSGMPLPLPHLQPQRHLPLLPPPLPLLWFEGCTAYASVALRRNEPAGARRSKAVVRYHWLRPSEEKISMNIPERPMRKSWRRAAQEPEYPTTHPELPMVSISASASLEAQHRERPPPMDGTEMQSCFFPRGLLI